MNKIGLSVSVSGARISSSPSAATMRLWTVPVGRWFKNDPKRLEKARVEAQG